MKICKICNEIKDISMFEVNRNQCRQCRNQQAKERRARQKKEDLILFKCKEMAGSAYARVFAPSRAYKTGYRELIEPFGFSDSGELASYLYENFYNNIKQLLDSGQVPSIDRIDEAIGYTKNNIRILEFKENTERGLSNRRRKVKMTTLQGEVIIFQSTVECANYFGYNSRSTSRVSSWCKKDHRYRIPDGFVFEYV